MQSAKSRRFFHVFHNWMSTKEKQYTFLCHSSKVYPFSIVRDSRCRIYSLILVLVFFFRLLFCDFLCFFFFFCFSHPEPLAPRDKGTPLVHSWSFTSASVPLGDCACFLLLLPQFSFLAFFFQSDCHRVLCTRAQQTGVRKAFKTAKTTTTTTNVY